MQFLICISHEHLTNDLIMSLPPILRLHFHYFDVCNLVTLMSSCHSQNYKQFSDLYNRENDLYNFSKRNVHFSPFFRGSSSSLEYHLKGF